MLWIQNPPPLRNTVDVYFLCNKTWYTRSVWLIVHHLNNFPGAVIIHLCITIHFFGNVHQEPPLTWGEGTCDQTAFIKSPNSSDTEGPKWAAVSGLKLWFSTGHHNILLTSHSLQPLFHFGWRGQQLQHMSWFEVNCLRNLKNSDLHISLLQKQVVVSGDQKVLWLWLSSLKTLLGDHHVIHQVMSCVEPNRQWNCLKKL